MSVPEGTYFGTNDYLLSPSQQYQLIMQSDGNLVLYNLTNGAALWATGTEGNSGDYAVFQTDGNFVVYSSSGVALWNSHTYTYSGLTRTMQSDGNAVIYQGSQPLWATDTASDEMYCWLQSDCTPEDFVWAFLQIPPTAPLTGVNAPTTEANDYAMSEWERQEGDPIQSNPLDTTKQEPGSTPYNSAGVQVYHAADNESPDCWGIDATDWTLLNGSYANILAVLREPVNSPYQQCIDLSNAVNNSPWGTGSFADLC